MNVDHLREFVALGKSRNFTKVAREFNIVQSTLSKHIASLEHELGFQLFDREVGSVTLTEAGKTFFEGTVAALEALDESTVKAHLCAMQEAATVLIGGYLQIASIGNWIYRVETVANELDNPIHIALYSRHTIDYMPESARDDALDLLRSGQIDIAIIEGPCSFPELEHFEWRHIYDEPIVFFAHISNELAHQQAVHISDLRDKHFIGALNYPEFQDRIREICGQHGFVPEFTIKMVDTFNEFIRTDNPDEIYFLSVNGAQRVPDPPNSPLAKLNIVDADAYSPIYAIWNHDPGTAVRGFVAAMDELLKREQMPSITL